MAHPRADAAQLIRDGDFNASSHRHRRALATARIPLDLDGHAHSEQLNRSAAAYQKFTNSGQRSSLAKQIERMAGDPKGTALPVITY